MADKFKTEGMTVNEILNLDYETLHSFDKRDISRALRTVSLAANKRIDRLLKNVHLVKAIIFPVVMYGCESWTITKAECQRIDVFELRCWRRLLSLLKVILPPITVDNNHFVIVLREDNVPIHILKSFFLSSFIFLY